MRARDLETLEFTRVLDAIAALARSAAGRQAVLDLRPTSERAEAERRLDLLAELVALASEAGRPPTADVPLLAPALAAAAPDGATLEPRRLAEVRDLLAAARQLRAYLRRDPARFPRLAAEGEAIDPVPEVSQPLGAALDETGQARDDASPTLAAARAVTRELRGEMEARLLGMVRDPDMGSVIGEQYVTVRNGRFVVPIRTAAAGGFAGVVQDRSASGETVFMEPLFAVELNNRLLLAAKDEEAEERRVRSELTALVRAHGARRALRPGRGGEPPPAARRRARRHRRRAVDRPRPLHLHRPHREPGPHRDGGRAGHARAPRRARRGDRPGRGRRARGRAPDRPPRARVAHRLHLALPAGEDLRARRAGARRRRLRRRSHDRRAALQARLPHRGPEPGAADRAPPRASGARARDGGAAAHRREPRPRARRRPPRGEPPRLRGGTRGGRARACPPGGRARGGRGARRGPARAPASPLGRRPGRLAPLPARARGARAHGARGSASAPRAGDAACLRARGERGDRRPDARNRARAVAHASARPGRPGRGGGSRHPRRAGRDRGRAGAHPARRPPLRGPVRPAPRRRRRPGARARRNRGRPPRRRARRDQPDRPAGARRDRRARRLPRPRRAGRALRGARRARDRERGAAARRARVPGELAVLRWVPRVGTGGGWGGRDDRGAGLRASRRESRGAAPLTTSSSTTGVLAPRAKCRAAAVAYGRAEAPATPDDPAPIRRPRPRPRRRPAREGPSRAARPLTCRRR